MFFCCTSYLKNILNSQNILKTTLQLKRFTSDNLELCLRKNLKKMSISFVLIFCCHQRNTEGSISMDGGRCSVNRSVAEMDGECGKVSKWLGHQRIYLRRLCVAQIN